MNTGLRTWLVVAGATLASGPIPAAADDGPRSVEAGTAAVCSNEPLLALPEPGPNIDNGPCAWCHQNSGCSTPCIDDNGNQSSCGDYGVCDPCREALVEIQRVEIGRKGRTRRRREELVCEQKWHYNVTYRSQNSPSCPTYTRCETVTEIWPFVPELRTCCNLFVGGCYGTAC